MIATITSAGTPNSAWARASAASFSRQNATPASMRAVLRNCGEYSYHFGGVSSGRDIAVTTLGCARHLREHAPQCRRVETFRGDQIRDEGLHVRSPPHSPVPALPRQALHSGRLMSTTHSSARAME